MKQNITLEERIKIEALHDQGLSAPAIARYLQRHKTSVYRELSKRQHGKSYDYQYAHKLSATNIGSVADIQANVTTVAGISSNVTSVAGNATNINAVAADATDISAVAGKATEIGLLGTSAVITDLGILGTADVVADLNTLGTADVVADLNTLGTADVVSDMNTLATTSNVSNMSTCAGSITNINNAPTNATNAATSATNAAASATSAAAYKIATSGIYVQQSSGPFNVNSNQDWGSITDIGSGAVFTGETSNVLLTLSEGSSTYDYASIT